MRPAQAVLLAMVFAAQACHERPEAMVTITHSINGLTLSLPKSMQLDGAPEPPTVTESAAGFHVALGARSKRRVRIEASVALHAEAQPPGPWPSQREIEGRLIHYRIDRAEGGSGGTQIEIRAWEACANGHLAYVQGDVVEEPGRPDFALVWQVIAGMQPPR